MSTYRLEGGDEVRAIGRMREVSRTWHEQRVGRRTYGPTDLDSLVRIGAHAVGCSLVELTEPEADWMRRTARELLDALNA